MATLYGAQATNRDVTVPSVKIDVSLNHGRVRRAYDSYTIPAANELAVGDLIYMMKLPKDSRIVDARLVAPVGGGSDGIVKVGWLTNGSDAADDNGLFAVAEGDFGAAALNAKLLPTAEGYNKKLAAETQILMEVTEATTDSGSQVLELEVFYIVD